MIQNRSLSIQAREILPYLYGSRGSNSVFTEQYTLARYRVFASKFQSALEVISRHVAAREIELHDETFDDPNFQRGYIKKTPFLPGFRTRLQYLECPTPFGVKILHSPQEFRDCVCVGSHSIENDGFASNRLADSFLCLAKF